MDKTKRSKRRADRERLIQKSVNREMERWSGFGLPSPDNETYAPKMGYGFWYQGEFFLDTKEEHRRYAEIIARQVYNNPAVCSCSMCGNPRKYHGEEKVSVRRQLQAEANQIEEYFLDSGFIENYLTLRTERAIIAVC